jgi:PA14 domain-containing protein
MCAEHRLRWPPACPRACYEVAVVGGVLRWADARFERRRLLAGGIGAVALHSLVLLFTGAERRTLELAPSAASTFFQIDTLSGEGGDPGGGVPNPAPDGPERADDEPPEVTPRLRTPRVARAAPARAALTDPLLASAFGDDSFLSQLRPAKASVRDLLKSAGPTPAEPPANDRALQARHLGSGPGSGTGPGGPGAGYGNGGAVTGDFAFGSTSGALRVELCFIPEGTTRLRNVLQCSGGAVFFADELNVGVRRFDEGFPGVTLRNEWFTLQYSGVFKVQHAGEYEFRLKSDDGSLLYIDGELVIDHDGVHDAISKRGEIDLEAGTHQILVRYFQGPRFNVALQLFVTPPGQPERIFRPEL